MQDTRLKSQRKHVSDIVRVRQWVSVKNLDAKRQADRCEILKAFYDETGINKRNDG